LLTNSSISTTANTSYGVYADASVFAPATQGQVVLNNVSISTQGSSSHAVFLDGSRAGVTAAITGGSFTTSGNQSAGIYLTQGAQATVTDAIVQTTGTSSYGISMNQNGSQIALDHVSVTTAGNTADAVWAPNNTSITASNFNIHTTGGTALGFDDRASTITLTNGSILTEGANSHALYASQEYSTPAAITGENLDIQTEGAGAAGAWARLGGQISLSDSTVATAGDTSIGVRASPGSTISLSNTNIETSGATAYGVYSQGIVNMLNGAIHTTGQAAYGVAMVDGGQVSLGGVDVLADGVDAVGAAFSGTTSATEGGTFSMDGGSLISTQSDAFAAKGNANIELSNGVQAIGGSGVLLDVRDVAGQVALTMDNNVVAQGDIVFDPSLVSVGTTPAANTTVSLSNGSQWTGADAECGEQFVAGKRQLMDHDGRLRRRSARVERFRHRVCAIAERQLQNACSERRPVRRRWCDRHEHAAQRGRCARQSADRPLAHSWQRHDHGCSAVGCHAPGDRCSDSLP
jgi:hypothetical protein